MIRNTKQNKQLSKHTFVFCGSDCFGEKLSGQPDLCGRSMCLIIFIPSQMNNIADKIITTRLSVMLSKAANALKAGENLLTA